jgi:hypothetical protein
MKLTSCSIALLGKLLVGQLQKKFLPLRNQNFNFACLQQPAKGSYPDPEESCHYGTPSLTYLVYNSLPMVSILI